MRLYDLKNTLLRFKKYASTFLKIRFFVLKIRFFVLKLFYFAQSFTIL